MSAMAIVSPIVSLIGGGLAGGVLSLYFNRRFYLRKMRTELYPYIEKMVDRYRIRLILPEGKGWIVDGRKYRPGPSDEDFRAARKELISRLVGFNELKGSAGTQSRNDFQRNSTRPRGRLPNSRVEEGGERAFSVLYEATERASSGAQ